MSNKTSATTILIGGAEGALGRLALQVFAQRGLKVVGACRTEADRERTLAELKQNHIDNVRLFACDLGDEHAVAQLISDAETSLGGIDALFNAAGGFRYGAVDTTTTADFDFLMTANLKSCFLLSRAVVPKMAKRGFGRIVFVSSRATLASGEANMGPYVASKIAINALVGALAAEQRQAGITVNAVLPTIIDTPANRAAMPGANFADWVTPTALLDVVTMLMGPTGAPINGALIPIAGRL